jgi:signal transduction histidine kinase
MVLTGIAYFGPALAALLPMSRAFALLVAALVALLLAQAFVEPDGDNSLAEAHRRTTAVIHAAETDLQQTLTSAASTISSLSPDAWMRSHAETFNTTLSPQGTLLLIYQHDSLVAWTGQVPREWTEAPPPIRPFVHVATGLYLHASTPVGPYHLHAVRNIVYEAPISNTYLRSGSHPSLHLPKGLQALPPLGTGASVTTISGIPLFDLQLADGALDFGTWIILRLLLHTLGGLLLLLALWHFGTAIASHKGPLAGAVVFVSALLLLRGTTLAFWPSSTFDRLPLFDPAIYATSWIFPSLGDLLINAAILLAMALFGLRMAARTTKRNTGAFGALLAWSGLLLFAAWNTRLVIGLVDNSVDLDLFHIEQLRPLSALALLAIALLHAAWWITALVVVRLHAPTVHRLRAWSIPALVTVLWIVAHVVQGVPDTVLFLWPFPLLALLLRYHRTRLPFAVGASTVALFALLSTHVLIKYSRQREERERPVLADRLAVREDPVVELLFRSAAPNLRTDGGLSALLNGPGPCDAQQLDELVRQRFFTGYWERYDVRLYALDTMGRLRCTNTTAQPFTISDGEDPFNDPLAMADMPDLFIEEQPGRSPFYHARLAVMRNDSTPAGQLLLEIHPRSTFQGMGFPDLLLAGDDPLARRTQRYSMGRYESGLLAESTGAFPLPFRWNDTLPAEGLEWSDVEGFRVLAKGDPSGTLIVLATPAPSLLDQATSFSYLFACFGGLVVLTLGVRALLKPRRDRTIGIGSKVRLALLFFTLVGLAFFGFGAQRLLSRQFEEGNQRNALARARSVAAELQHRFAGTTAIPPEEAGYLQHLLARASNIFLTDIVVHGPDGRLLASSRPQIFTSGLLGPLMDPVAYTRLALEGSQGFVHQESIGTAAYTAAYVPLHDADGNTLAFVSLPSFTDRARQDEERAGVLVAVANLFVLFFALSVLVAVFISNWTTRPLDLLKNALGRVALQGANVPIRYQGNDEVGQLVEVYNRKVEELRASAELLARSERESAWREMARQVAHEIKNPLTPMKLSIQHFQRTWKPDAPDAAERLERFSRGMVEQIDTLSGIAGAFSNFAQLPKPRPEPLDLAQVAEAAVSVYQATPGLQCTLERLSDQPLTVLADRDHLMRVFNNLLKNAQQAIPEDREGRVEVRLRSTGAEVIAEVRDNGTGIAEADRERIFRPNFTTKSSGMGLGLAMVQRMVEGAGGRVWFESREGAGSSFFVALPLKA